MKSISRENSFHKIRTNNNNVFQNKSASSQLLLGIIFKFSFDLGEFKEINLLLIPLKASIDLNIFKETKSKSIWLNSVKFQAKFGDDFCTFHGL